LRIERLLADTDTVSADNPLEAVLRSAATSNQWCSL
jgi:hypothetical protein